MNRPPLAASLLACTLIVLGSGLLSHCGETDQAGNAAYAHTQAIVAFGPRPPGSESLDKSRRYVSEALTKHGWITQAREFTSFTPKGQVTFTNLVARYAPDGDNPEVWTRPAQGILCAHLDSKLFDDQIFLGADDAASAVALILELAPDLARNDPAKAKQLELAFFDGEEAFGPSLTPRDGIYGSRRYAAAWRRQEHKPSFGILLDMIGHKDLSIAIPSDSPKHLADLLFKTANDLKQQNRFRRSPSPIIDDHVPLNNAGIPTIDIIGDFASANWWHNSRDNMDLISPRSLEISFQVVRTMLDELL